MVKICFQVGKNGLNSSQPMTETWLHAILFFTESALAGSRKGSPSISDKNKAPPDKGLTMINDLHK